MCICYRVIVFVHWEILRIVTQVIRIVDASAFRFNSYLFSKLAYYKFVSNYH